MFEDPEVTRFLRNGIPNFKKLEKIKRFSKDAMRDKGNCNTSYVAHILFILTWLRSGDIATALTGRSVT